MLIISMSMMNALILIHSQKVNETRVQNSNYATRKCTKIKNSLGTQRYSIKFVNVDGEIFSVPLQKLDTTFRFSKLTKLVKEDCRIERNSKHFKHISNYLYEVDSVTHLCIQSLKEIGVEAWWYGLDGLGRRCDDLVKCQKITVAAPDRFEWFKTSSEVEKLQAYFKLFV